MGKHGVPDWRRRMRRMRRRRRRQGEERKEEAEERTSMALASCRIMATRLLPRKPYPTNPTRRFLPTADDEDMIGSTDEPKKD